MTALSVSRLLALLLFVVHGRGETAAAAAAAASATTA